VNSDAIEAIPVPAFVISQDDRLVTANTACQSLFPRLQVGRSYLTVLRHPNLVALVSALRLGRSVEPIEVSIKGQSEAEYRVSGAMLGTEGILICLQDANETAMAIQMRQNFVADLGHELKTPLTAISGILETCQGDADAIAHFLPVMSSEVERMKRLVADLLTLSRIESNARRRADRDVVLQDVVASACTPLAVLSKATGVRIEIALPDAQVRFQGDADEIVRAISNLVENGLRYGNPKGFVRVSGRVDSGASTVVIEVSDDGPGVEIHHIPRLTERFYRVDTHRSRDSGGSGLGLAIVKHIVNHHRGRMSFDSVPNQGSTVTLEFPVVQV